jgi:arginine N-succinyltransferase
MVYFINLPPEERLIAAKIEHSVRCFRRLAGAPGSAPPPKRRKGQSLSGYAAIEEDSDLFMFTIMDVDDGGVIGTSQVRPRQGGPGNPNWGFKVTEKKFHSESLGFGTTHKVGQLYGDESGPTEIGGLIIQPSHRGHRLRPGRLLSFVRFHFMGLYREAFADRVLAEMMAPVSSEGDNLFWDAFGRKFIPVKYVEADRFCQHNRKFISELLPKEEIYLTLFPLEVQNQLGVVSRETLPARRMLESLGFRYKGFIDPFDGGPHLEANTDEIVLVRETRRLKLGKPLAEADSGDPAIVSYTNDQGEFRATETPSRIEKDTVRLSRGAMKLLEVETGDRVGFTPTKRWHKDEPAAEAPAAKPSRRRVKA